MKSDDRLLFLGNPQQSVPKRLLLARNLSPRDKFTWQLLRLHARDDGSGVFPPTTNYRAGSPTSLRARRPRAVRSATRW